MSYNRVATVRHSRVIDRSPAYYAWIILVVATLAATLIGPGQIYAVSVFIDHFVVDLGISRGLASTLYTAGTLTASFALLYVGHQVDKRGSRLTIAFISFALGLASINMGFVRGALMLWVGFVALQMLGQGSLSLVSINVINQWWVRRWGIALLSGGCSPTYWPGSYPFYGWRTTYILLGMVLWVVLVPWCYYISATDPKTIVSNQTA